MVNKTKDGNEYWWCKKQCSGKGQWVHRKPEDHRNRTGTSLSSVMITKLPSRGDSNTKLNLTKDYKAGLLATKDQIYVLYLPYQFNINAQGHRDYHMRISERKLEDTASVP